MIVASGFVEANEPVDVKNVNEVKSVLDSLKDIDGVRSVYLAYYSLPGSDDNIEELLPISSN
jgi:predicted RND superfamily exporter protein